MSNFWTEQCPARGAALSHVHWGQCTPESHPGEDAGHLPFQCCHCRALNPAARMAHPAPEPDDAIRERMQRMGVRGSWGNIERNAPQEKDTGMEDIRAADHDDNTPVEPKAITGNGPTGRPDGKGRGELTGRQMSRLMNWKRYIDHLGEDGAPRE